MGFKENVIKKAQSLQNTTLLLPESTDERILQATAQIIEKQISKKIILCGDPDVIRNRAKECNIVLSEQVEIVNPATDSRKNDFVHQYFEMRKHKGLTEVQASNDMTMPIFYAIMMMKHNYASAMVAGAITTTADLLKAAIRIVGVEKNNSIVSSCMVMETSNKTLGHEGQLLFSDCGIIPKPSTEELVNITVATAKSCEAFLETTPIISLLSFSTKGSASHPEVDKVRKAVEILQERYPHLIVDGEMQMDAAINQKTGTSKAPNSPTAGKSNTLIFPDLAAGNISYKAAQQFGNMNAYGPFIQGLATTINDLSRGCTTEEIVIISAASLCQSC